MDTDSQGRRCPYHAWFNDPPAWATSYVKPLYMESNEFLEAIIAGAGSKYIEPERTPLTIDEIIARYRVSDHYKDNRGCQAFYQNSPLRRNRKYKKGSSWSCRQAISINNEEMQYLSVVPQNIKHKRASHAYSMFKKHRVTFVSKLSATKMRKMSTTLYGGSSKDPLSRHGGNPQRFLSGGKSRSPKDFAIVLDMFAGSLFHKLCDEYNQQQMNSALAYTLCVYFLAGLSLVQNGAPFFQYLVLLFEYLILLFLVAYFGSSVFFFLSANGLAGLLVSIFLHLSGFAIYPSNDPIYWKWLIYANPIYWANILYCKCQFNEGYTDPCTNFLSVTNSQQILANFLALLGRRNIEFTGASQSLPHLRKTSIIHSSKDYSHSKFQSSCSSGSYNSEDFSGYSVPQKLYSGYNHMNEGIKEFYIDVEMNGKGIPVEPVTFVFEGLTFSRYEEGSNESTPLFSYVTCYAKPQNMFALLGGSRTSKVTLLQCLAERIPFTGSLNGNVLVNGFPPGASFSSYYVMLRSLMLTKLTLSGHYCLSNTPYARTVPFFDLALILTKEGHQAYFGPRGSNHDIILDYFLLIPKNPRYSKRESPVRLTGCTMIDILMGSLYFRIEYKDIFGVTSHSLCIYMQVILIGVISANNVISQIGTDSCWDWQWHSRNRNRICSEFMRYWTVVFLFTLCITYFGMMVTFLAPLPTLAAFHVSIVTSIWVSASGVVVVLADTRFYSWM
ncbi:hypothetical protein WN943_003195 [Citrus x changshan-huyou]